MEFTSYRAMPKPAPPPAGEWVISDDTQMTLALEDALTDADPDDVEATTSAIVREFQAWARSPLNDRAPGTTCMGSLRNLAAGRSWWEPGGAIESGGCGSVMRLLPAAAAGEAHWAGLVALQAVVTHRHPLGVLPALALAEAMRDGGGLDAALAVIDGVDRGTWPVLADPYLGKVLAPHVPDVRAWLATEVPTMRKHLTAARERLASGHTGDPCEGVGEGWDAGTAAALAPMVADAGLPPFEALQWAATSNGDSDSIAAIAGMLLGSRSDSPTFWPDAGVAPGFEAVYQDRIMSAG